MTGKKRDGKNGQQIAAEHVLTFAAGEKECDIAKDWPDYLHGGKLARDSEGVQVPAERLLNQPKGQGSARRSGSQSSHRGRLPIALVEKTAQDYSDAVVAAEIPYEFQWEQLAGSMSVCQNNWQRP